MAQSLTRTPQVRPTSTQPAARLRAFGLSPDCRDELLLLLDRREDVSGSTAAAVLAAIAEGVVFYRGWIARDAAVTPLDRDERRWLRQTADLVAPLSEHLLRTPHVRLLDLGEQGVRELLAAVGSLQAIARRADLVRQAHQHRRSGKPTDTRRAILDLSTAIALRRAGIRLTKAQDGTLARVLRLVRTEVGLPAEGAYKAVCRACDMSRRVQFTNRSPNSSDRE